MSAAVSHVDQEGPGERLGQVVGELVEEDEGQDFQSPGPGEGLQERLPDRIAQGAGGLEAFLRLGCAPGDEQHGEEDQPQQRVHHPPAEERRQADRTPSGDQHRGAVERHPGAHRHPVLLGTEHLHRVGIHHDVLRSGSDPQGERQRPHHPDGVRVVPDTPEQEAEAEERHLGDGHPAAPPSPEARDVAVHERRPEDLERPGDLRQVEEPDDADVHPDVTHPVGNGDPDKAKGQPRRERQQRDREGPPGAEGAQDGPEARHVPLRCPCKATRTRNRRTPPRSPGQMDAPTPSRTGARQLASRWPSPSCANARG